MYYVLQDQSEHVIDWFDYLSNAKIFAESLREKTGCHYRIEKREWVWGTRTLAELDR